MWRQRVTSSSLLTPIAISREVAAGRFREDLFARIKLWSPFIASTDNFTAR